MPKSDRQRFVIPLLLCLIVAALAYANAISNEFVGDDIGRIVYEQPALSAGFASTVTTIVPDRPLLAASIWANYSLSELDPVSYKIVNIVLHALTGFALFLVSQMLWTSLRESPLLALLPVLIFLAHPLNNQSLNSVIQRGVLMASMFSLFALYVSMKARDEGKRWAGWIALLFGCLAVLSKPNALSLPFLLFAYLMLVKRDSFRSAFRFSAPLLSIGLIPVTFYSVLGMSEQYGTLSWSEYALVQSRVIFNYFALFFVPIDLHFIYDVPSSSGAQTVLAVLGHIAIFGFIFWCARRGFRALAFCFTCVYLCLLPESSVFAIRHVMFEHRTYLPLAFFLLGAGTCLVLWLQSLNRKAARLAYVSGTVIVLGFVFMNSAYSAKISTYEKWTFYNLEKNPNDANFNTFSVNEFFDRNLASGAELADRLIKIDPENLVYLTYRRLFAYPTMNAEEQRHFLDSLYGNLTNSALIIHRDARLKFNQFYGRSIQHFVSGPAYWELVDDLLFSQLDVFRKNEGYFSSLYVIQQNNLVRLVQHYRSANVISPRYLRALLMLKFDFAVKDPALDRRIVELNASLKDNPEAVKLARHYEERGARELPLVNTRID